jgi:hypothetical protein
LILCWLVVLAMTGCGIAPVHRGGVPSGPPTWIYLGPHGRPLAFGGDVCEVAGRHAHEYPPSPQDAFTNVDGKGWRDTRKLWPFFGPHPHHGRTCFREGWHRHLEPPDEGLVYDETKGAYRRPDATLSP